MSVLDLLAQKHKEWVRMAHSFGAGAYAEDVVQEMYLRLNKYVDDPERIMYKDEPNKLFVWVTLRNMVRNLQTKKEIIVYTDEIIDFDLLEEEYDMDNALGFERLVDKVWELSDDFHWYHKKLFEIYHTTDMSMRDIAKETGISLYSIFDSLRKSKNLIKENLHEDWEDHTNNEGERI